MENQEHGIVFLKGRKVNLRPLSKSDLPRCTRWINDPSIRFFLKNAFPISAEEEEAWFQSLAKSKPNNVLFAIETKEGQHIGNMGIHRINWIDRIGTTGALIGEHDFLGKGYGTEAKKLLLKYAFDDLNLRKICSNAYAFNTRSIAYSKKCGYKEEGVLREHIFRNGAYQDLVNLAVFRHDFAPIWQQYISEGGVTK